MVHSLGILLISLRMFAFALAPTRILLCVTAALETNSASQIRWRISLVSLNLADIGDYSVLYFMDCRTDDIVGTTTQQAGFPGLKTLIVAVSHLSTTSPCFDDPSTATNLRPKVVEYLEKVHVLPDALDFPPLHYELYQR